jgi:hypothetical protein
MANVWEKVSGSQYIIDAHEKASQTGLWVVGEMVNIDSTGRVVIAAAGAITGMALTAPSGTVDTTIRIDCVFPDQVWAQKYGTTTANTLEGLKKDITFTTGSQAVASTANAADVVIQKVDSRDALGTSAGRVLVRFVPASCAMITGI